MTLNDLRIDLSAKLGNPDVGENILNRWINNAYARLYRKMVKANPLYFVTSVSVNTVGGTQEYALASDVNKIVMVNVQWTTDGQWYRANPLQDIGQVPVIQRTDSNQGFTQSNPYYYVAGNYIGLTPIPDESVTSGLYYKYIPAYTELDVSTDQPAIDPEWHELIVWGAAMQYNYRDEEVGLMDRAKREFDDGMAEFEEYIDEIQIDAHNRIVVVDDSGLSGGTSESYYHYQE